MGGAEGDAGPLVAAHAGCFRVRVIGTMSARPAATGVEARGVEPVRADAVLDARAADMAGACAPTATGTQISGSDVHRGLPRARGRRADGPWSVLLAVGVLVVFGAWLRAPAFVTPGFVSHDVGGILLEAMVLRDGGLPYVDTVELKSPGCFYVARALAGPRAIDIDLLQRWAQVCALTTAAIVIVGAAPWGRRRSLWICGALYVPLSAWLDSMDANYVTWAALPHAGAGVLGLAALGGDGDARDERDSAGARTHFLWFCAGACAGLAALCKTPDGIVGLVLLVWALAWPREHGRRGIACVLVIGGGIAVHVPVLVHYALQGELSALVRHYPLGAWGVRYLWAGAAARADGAGAGTIAWTLDAAREIVAATAHFLGLALVPCAAIVASRGLAGPAQRSRAVALALWLGADLAAAYVGLRMYQGYFLAAAAPACLLAAAPWGPLWGPRALSERGGDDAITGDRGDARSGPRVEGPGASPSWHTHGLRALAWAAMLAVAARHGALLVSARADRARRHDAGAQAIATHIAQHSPPDARIWVWGWHLWGVYALSDRRSASTIYKSLGLLTPPNDDTWRRPASPLRFVDGPSAARVLDDLDRRRPAFIVLGSTVPRGEFTALQRFLRAHYELDRRIHVGRVHVYRLRHDAADEDPRRSSDPR